MNAFSIADYRHMARALRLAERGLYTTHPNPRVGCVIVRDDVIVGEGFHAAAGEAHAEVNALAAAGEAARGATAYVTLEPCAHEGRTGPCSRALLDAAIARVVYACDDPNPEVSGRGAQMLSEAGVRVESGLMREAARELNAGFISRHEKGRPFVRVKLAASLDGATAMSGGESQWITGEAARADVQRWRARSDAIITGVGTVLADDPRLDVRLPNCRRQPLAVVLDSQLRTPHTARILAGGALLVTLAAGGEALQAAGAEILRLNGETIAPADVLRELALRDINEVLVEAGPRVAGSFLAAGLADELVIYQSPHIMGSNTRPLAETPAWTALADRLALTIRDRRMVGRDLRLVAVPRRTPD